MILRMTQEQHELMRRLTQLSFAPGVEFPSETGCILFTTRPSESAPFLLVGEVFEPAEGDLRETSTEGLVFSRQYLRRALLRLRQGGFGGFITVHTHPLSDNTVEFSSYDDLNDPDLMRNLCDLEPGATFGSMVAGHHVLKGRIWCPQRLDFDELEKIVVIGEQVRFANRPPLTTTFSPAAELFDRSLALTGTGALATLANMRVAVVGAGGTGSLMVELLARAGVGEVIIFDFDRAEASNLNRVLHLRKADVERNSSKAERLREAVSDLGLPTKVSVSGYGGDIRDLATANELADCDLIVGCVDRDWPRLVLCEVAYQFLVPLVDLGTEISASNGEIQSLDVRVSLAGPGRPCLLCSGVVSPDRVRVEGFATVEQERQIATGYSPDMRLGAPAVMDLNMRAASQAMLVIRHLLQPFLASPLAHTYRETVTSFHVRSLRFTSRADCPICAPTRLGVGNAHRLTTRADMQADGFDTQTKPAGIETVL